jgi:hypothetical protein
MVWTDAKLLDLMATAFFCRLPVMAILMESKAKAVKGIIGLLLMQALIPVAFTSTATAILPHIVSDFI